jgi:hypothetical protein
MSFSFSRKLLCHWGRVDAEDSDEGNNNEEDSNEDSRDMES